MREDIEDKLTIGVGCGLFVALAAGGIMTCDHFVTKSDNKDRAEAEQAYVQTYVKPAVDLEAKIVDIVMYGKSRSIGKYSSISIQEPQFVFESNGKRFVAEYPIIEYAQKEAVSLLHAKVQNKEDTPIKLHGTTVKDTFYIVSISFDDKKYDTPFIAGSMK